MWAYIQTYPACCELLNTSDGSIVATFSSPYGPAGLTIDKISCDGAYAFLESQLPTSPAQKFLLFVDQETGAVVAQSPAFSGGFPAAAIFPCPIRGMGGAFKTGRPAEKRAVTQVRDGLSSEGTLTIWNLETGQPIFVGAAISGTGPQLNCTNDTLMYTDAATTKLRLVRLQDGTAIDVTTTDQLISIPFGLGGC